MNRLTVGIIIAAYTLSIVGLLSVAFVRHQRKEEKRQGEVYKKLEFRVIHRPHVTYFVDLKYMLCFATTKPEHHGIGQIQCTDFLISETVDALKVKGAP